MCRPQPIHVILPHLHLHDLHITPSFLGENLGFKEQAKAGCHFLAAPLSLAIQFGAGMGDVDAIWAELQVAFRTGET
jgi:hypothetical protein